MTPADTKAAWYLVDLWRDGISYHVSDVDILRLHEIASGVIARVRTENFGEDVVLASRGRKR